MLLMIQEICKYAMILLDEFKIAIQQRVYNRIQLI